MERERKREGRRSKRQGGMKKGGKRKTETKKREERREGGAGRGGADKIFRKIQAKNLTHAINLPWQGPRPGFFPPSIPEQEEEIEGDQEELR